MHYYIDGYNILFRVLYAGSDLKKQRESFITDLNEKIKILNLDVTIVFDAHYTLAEGTRSVFDSLEICFTSSGESADEYILKKIKSCPHPKQETVVTSDNRLAWAARRYLAKTESVATFLTWLNKRYETRLLKNEGEKLSVRPISLPKFQVVSEVHAKDVELPPQPGKSAIESFDYYLYQFEKEFRESIAKELSQKNEPKKRKAPFKSHKKDAIPDVKDVQEPDMQRWQRLFEEKDLDS